MRSLRSTSLMVSEGRRAFLRSCAMLVLSALLAGSVPGLAASLWAADEMSWERLSSGLAVSVWQPGRDCDQQVPPVLVLKIDPQRYRFSMHHFRDEGLDAPLTISDWLSRTGATVVFNAGLFREDYSYLGLFFKDGRSLGSNLHPRWKGLFVAEPVAPSLRKARVIDLAKEPFSADRPEYLEVAQSLMLVDATGRPRVRHTTRRARQTVVGEDQAGNILVMKTDLGVALWDLAVCLRDQMPSLHHAMVMDGGSSSDLLVEGRLLAGTRSGGPGVSQNGWRGMVDGSSTAHIRLPAVIAVEPRP